MDWDGLREARCFRGKTSEHSAVTGVICPPEFHPAPSLLGSAPCCQRVLSRDLLGRRGENSSGAKELQPRALKLAEVQGREAALLWKGLGCLIANSTTGFARKCLRAQPPPPNLFPASRGAQRLLPGSGVAALGCFSPRTEAQDGAGNGRAVLCPCRTSWGSLGANPTRAALRARRGGFTRRLVRMWG